MSGKVADDPVNSPKHYNNHRSNVECISISKECNFCIGNAIKYLWRHPYKGKPVEDLKKAMWYIDCEVARRHEASMLEENLKKWRQYETNEKVILAVDALMTAHYNPGINGVRPLILAKDCIGELI